MKLNEETKQDFRKFLVLLSVFMGWAWVMLSVVSEADIPRENIEASD